MRALGGTFLRVGVAVGLSAGWGFTAGPELSHSWPSDEDAVGGVDSGRGGCKRAPLSHMGFSPRHVVGGVGVGPQDAAKVCDCNAVCFPKEMCWEVLDLALEASQVHRLPVPSLHPPVSPNFPCSALPCLSPAGPRASPLALLLFVSVWTGVCLAGFCAAFRFSGISRSVFRSFCSAGGASGGPPFSRCLFGRASPYLRVSVFRPAPAPSLGLSRPLGVFGFVRAVPRLALLV